jgi:hypothetical protein
LYLYFSQMKYPEAASNNNEMTMINIFFDNRK